VSPAEIAAATADVACKQRTNLIGAWRGYEVTIQNARIAADPQGFHAAKTSHDARTARVATILTRCATGPGACR
jgi:hypothetical protein